MATTVGTDRGHHRPLRVLGATILGAVLLQTAFVAGLVAAQAVPNSSIITALSTATEGKAFADDWDGDGLGGLRDGFTTCLALSTGINPPAGMGLLKQSLYAAELVPDDPPRGRCPQTADDIRTLAAGGQVPQWSYARYWHGYLVITRPALWIGGLEGLAAYTLLLFIASLGLAVFALASRLGWLVATAVLSPVLISTNVIAVLTTDPTHAVTWSVILASVGAITLVTDRWGWQYGTVAVALCAAIFNYVDFLTTPPAAWALSVFAVASVVNATGPPRRVLLQSVIVSGLAWPCAYALTWVTKWVLSAVVVDPHSLAEVRDKVVSRSVGPVGGAPTTFGVTTLKNLGYWWGGLDTSHLVLPAAVLAVVCCLGLVLRRSGKQRGEGLFVLFVLSLPAVVVPVWYEVLRNHSQVHVWFTYRSVPVAIGIGVAAAILAVRTSRRDLALTDGDTGRPD